MKKVLSIVLSANLLLTPVLASVPSDFSDIPNNWAKEPIISAIENGLLNGSNGKINPMGNLTRAEMAAIIGRTVKAQNTKDISAFTDVSSSAWYYNDVAKACAMGVIEGSGSSMRPNASISRQETMVVLSRLFKLDDGDTSVLSSFTDGDKIASWAKNGVAAMVSAKYVQGSAGKINPNGFITRAEFAAIMDRMVDEYLSKAETYNQLKGENVMINTVNGGTTLKDVTVSGNLIIGDGVADGDVILENVTIKGAVIVRGGGENSIKLTGKTSAPSVVVAKPQGGVRVASEGEASIGTISVKSNNNVIVTGKVDSVNVATNAAQVTAKDATIATITVAGEGSKVTLSGNTTVTEVKTAETAANVAISVAKEATVSSVAISGDKTVISGEGTVKTADVKGDNVQVNTNSTQVTVDTSASGVTAGSKNLGSGSTTTTDKNTSTQTPGGVTDPKPNPNPNPNPNPGPGPGPGPGPSARIDEIKSLAVYGLKGGSGSEVTLANATFVTNTGSTKDCVLDLSKCADNDVISAGLMTTIYGSSFTVGSYSAPTGKRITVNELYKIMMPNSTTESITVGALKSLIADKELLKNTFEARTGKTWPSQYIDITGNTITITASLPLDGRAETVKVIIKLA